MARFATELFIQCVYSLDLSYHDLLEREAALKVELTTILEQSEGEYIHFEVMGDVMRVQCVFPRYAEDVFHALCGRVAPLMDGQVEAKMLFVSKDLDFLHIYTLSKGEWLESCLHVPAAGPLTRALRDLDPSGTR